ncbi:MAG: CRISPR-associated endonuclease Cas1 [Methanosphaera sp.]|nr:CRISPR-associated endonuclease Cas1 [Methanosphaera sp.]
MKMIIEGYNKSIHKKNNQIIVKQKEEIIYKISVRNISDILIIGKGYITFDALTLISQNNIPVISTNHYGRIDYILKSPYDENIMLRKKQYKTSENYQGLLISKEIIKSKIYNQYYTLNTLNKRKKNKELNEIKEKIKKNLKILDKLEIKDNNEINKLKKKIMGIEGITSVEYWRAIRIILPEEINFETRKQKPHLDVTNAMLNYGYAILASEITKIIITEKLDPYCGLLHADLNKRTSLTYDIIEEFRQQIVDKTVIALINRKQITEEDIDKRTNQLKKESKYILIKNIMDKIHKKISYENQEQEYSEIMQKQVKNIRKAIVNIEEYKGFKIKW